MNTLLEEKTSCCAIGSDESPKSADESSHRLLIAKYLFLGVVLLAAWWAIYQNLSALTHFFSHRLSGLLGFPPAGHLGSAIEFFLFETPKVLMLLTLVVFGVGMIRSFFTPLRSHLHWQRLP